MGYPVVVKPADRDRGEGVTIDIASDASVREAFEKARRLSRRVLVEKQVPGICHRIFVAGDRVLYVVKRLPKSVIGDGKLTVAELVHTQMPSRANGGSSAPAHISRRSTRGRRDPCRRLRPATIPPAGTFVPLRRIESTEWGGTPEVMTEVMHEENRRIALKAASLMRLNVVGFRPDLYRHSSPLVRKWSRDQRSEFRTQTRNAIRISDRRHRCNADRCLSRQRQASGRVLCRQRESTRCGTWPARRCWHGEGKRCFLSTHTTMLDPSGKPVAMPSAMQALFMRAKALLLDPCVDALLLVVQTDELLYTGLPVDSIDRLHVVDNQLAAWGASRSPLHARAAEMLVRQLASLLHRRRADLNLQHQSTGTAQRRDQAPYRRGRHLPQRSRHLSLGRRIVARTKQRVGTTASLHDAGKLGRGRRQSDRQPDRRGSLIGMPATPEMKTS